MLHILDSVSLSLYCYYIIYQVLQNTCVSVCFVCYVCRLSPLKSVLAPPRRMGREGTVQPAEHRVSC